MAVKVLVQWDGFRKVPKLLRQIPFSIISTKRASELIACRTVLLFTCNIKTSQHSQLREQCRVCLSLSACRNHKVSYLKGFQEQRKEK